MAFDTFDSDVIVTLGVLFSNGNLTVKGDSGSGGTGSAPVRAQTVEGKKSGKWYIEFTYNTTTDGFDRVGVCNGWGTGGTYVGGSHGVTPSHEAGWGHYTGGSIIHLGAAQTNVNGVSWTTGDVIGVAIDLTNSRVWFRKNTGSWIGTAGTPNPATNTNGFNISALLANGGRVFPTVSMSGTLGSQFTANFGASAFTGSVPSGFTAGWTITQTNYFGSLAYSSDSYGYADAPMDLGKAVSKYTSPLTGTLDTVVVYPPNNWIDIKAVIYSDSAGVPDVLLGTSSALASITAGEASFTFSGVNIVTGTAYWLGLTTDDNTASHIISSPPLTNGMATNLDGYAPPDNPFGSPSYENFRIPILAFGTPTPPYDSSNDDANCLIAM